MEGCSMFTDDYRRVYSSVITGEPCLLTDHGRGITFIKIRNIKSQTGFLQS